MGVSSSACVSSPNVARPLSPLGSILEIEKEPELFDPAIGRTTRTPDLATLGPQICSSVS